MFRNYVTFYGEDLSTPIPNPQAGEPQLVGCPWLLLQYNPGYLPYWKLPYGYANVHRTLTQPQLIEK